MKERYINYLVAERGYTLEQATAIADSKDWEQPKQERKNLQAEVNLAHEMQDCGYMDYEF